MTRGFRDNTRGGVTTAAAVVLPLLAFGAMGAIDLSLLHTRQTSLQATVDSAALAAAAELRIVGPDTRRVAHAALSFVAVRLGAPLDGGPAMPQAVPGQQRVQARAMLDDAAHGAPVVVSADIDLEKQTIQVQASQTVPTVIRSAVGVSPGTVSVAAVARVMGSSPLCLLGLEETKPNTLVLRSGAKVTANGCSIYSNSSSANGLVVDTTSSLTASRVCSVAMPVGKTNASPPTVICPAIRPDPLEHRKSLGAPHVCDPRVHYPARTLSGTVTWDPGIYCGDVDIASEAVVTLTGTNANPSGIYTLGGKLRIGDNAKVRMLSPGTGAAFYLTGTGQMTIGRDAHVSLSAPNRGELAGFVIFEDPARPAAPAGGADVLIRSRNVSQLLGTIYLRNGTLRIEPLATEARIGDQSAFTVVVARQIQIVQGANLVLNSNYSGTSVPVPAGVGPNAGTVLMER